MERGGGMELYYVNVNAAKTGEHEVHTWLCANVPGLNNRLLVGSFDHCKDALKEAKKIFPHVDGCARCCPECNKK
jgi:hypothetical protein